VKRLNRKKIIEDFEYLRQGFADAIMTSRLHKDAISLGTFRAYHKIANKTIVELGGESVNTP